MIGKCEIFKSFQGSAPHPAGGGGGGVTAPPDPKLEKRRAAHGLSCFARPTTVLFTFFVLRPDQFLFRSYGPASFFACLNVYAYVDACAHTCLFDKSGEENRLPRVDKVDMEQFGEFGAHNGQHGDQMSNCGNQVHTCDSRKLGKSFSPRLSPG